MYNKTILDHFHHPRNLEEMKNPDASGMSASPVCGDVMTIFLKMDKNIIQKASFTTIGCGAAIATGSVLTELLKGKTLHEAQSLTAQELVKSLGDLPAIKMHCPEIAIEALHNALRAAPQLKSS